MTMPVTLPQTIVKQILKTTVRTHLRLTFEQLECRYLLAFGIAHVTPDLTSSNKLFKVDTANVDLVSASVSQAVKPFLYGFSKGSNDNPDNVNSPARGFDDRVIAGDWGGTGYTSVGVAQNSDETRPPSPNANLRFLLDTDRDTTAEYAFQFGFASDKPVVGNFDGLYGDDIGVVRAASGELTWYVTTASNAPGRAFPRDGSVRPVNYQFKFGKAGDFALTGKFDNDQFDDLVVVRTSGNALQWEFHLSANRAYPTSNDALSIDRMLTFGSSGAKPIIGDWNGDGLDDIGFVVAVDGQSATWNLGSLVNGGLEVSLRKSIQFGQVQAGQENFFIVGNWAGNYFNGGGPALVNGPTDLGNLWSSTTAWSEGRVPTIGETVVIEQPPSVQITFDSGTFTGNLVTSNRLNVTGGTLQLGTLSNLGEVNLSGGTLQAAANLTPTAYSQTGGVLEVLVDEALGTAVLNISGGTIRSTIPQSSKANLRLSNAIQLTNTVDFESRNDSYLVLAGAISDVATPGSLRKIGGGSVLLSGNNSYSGTTTIDDGELIAASNTALGATSSGVQVNGTGTAPRLGLFGNVTIAEPISVAAGGRVDLRGGASLTAPLALNSGSSLLVENGTTVSGLVTLNGSGNVSFDSIAPVSIAASPLAAIISGQITGSGGLTLNTRLGLALQLSNSTNSYLGNTRVAGTGRVQLGGSQAIPAVGSLTVDSGATLTLSGFSQSGLQLLGGGRIDLGGGVLNVDSGSFSGVIAGAGTVRKSSVGTLTLTGSNAFTGSLEIATGTLTAGAVATLPTVPLSISLGATLDLLGNSQQVGSISGNGTVRGTGGTLIVNDTANSRFDGSLSGAIGVRKQGSGTWTLGAANSFTGGMQVTAGSLLLDAVNALGSGSLAVSSGAIVDMQQNQQVTILTNAGTVRANGVTLGISSNLSNNGAAIFENANGAVQTTGTSGEQALNFGSARPTNLTIAGGSRVNLQASSESFTLAGSLNVLAGTLDLNTKVVTTNALTLDGSATISGTGQLTSNGIAQLISGVVGIALAGPSGVRKSGSGTVTITTAGVYQGSTTVEQGTLDVQVSQGLGEGSIDVRTLGVLRLQGTHALSQLDNTGSVTAPSATIQLAGNLTNSGSLALGTLETVGSGTTQQVQLGSGSLDSMTSVGTANVQLSSLAATLNLSGSLTMQGGSINLGDEVVSAGRVVINGNSTSEIRGTGSLTSGAALDLRSGVVAVALRGSSGLTKSTVGAVTLLATNSFTGPVSIQAGTLIAGAANSIAGTVSTTLGATLDIRSTQGLVSLQNSGRLIANSATLQLSGDFVNTGDFQSGTSTLELSSNGPQAINLGASGAHSITKRGSGVASLQSSSNAITLTGDLTLEQGRMNLGSSVVVSRSFSLDGSSTIEGTGRLTSSSDFTLRSGTVAVSLSGSSGIRKAGSGTVTLQVPNALSGSTIVTDNGILSAIASNSLPTGNLQLAASSTVSVSGTQTVQLIDNLGTINAGTSTIQVRGDFSSPGIFNASSSTLVMNGTGEQRLQFGDNPLNNLTIEGQSNDVRLVSATATLNLTGSLIVRSGSLEAANTAIVSTSLLLDAGNEDAVRGTSTLASTSTFDLRNGIVQIELTGTAGLRKSSPGTVRLDVSASYQGESQVIEGSLLLNTPNAIPAQSPIQVGASGSVDFGNFSADIHSISNQGNVQVGEAELSLTNDLVNESSGTFTTGSTTLNLNGDLLNQGSWPSASASITWEGTSDSQRLLSNNATFSNLVKSSTGELIVEDLASVEGVYRQLSGDLRLAAGNLTVGTLVWNQGDLNSDSTTQSLGINIRDSATIEAGNLNAPIQGGNVWTKVGSGVVTFSAPIAYDLQLQVDGGEINVTQNASLPEQRDLDIAIGAILRVQSGNTSFANVDIAGDLVVGASTLVVQPIARNNQTVAEVSTVTGTVAGSSGLLKLGLGTLAWSGVNQITGVYEINEGNFELRSNSALASESSLVINGLGKVNVVSSNVGNSSLSGEGELSLDSRSQVATRGGRFSGVLSGAGIIAKQGQDNLELTRQSRGGFNGNLSVQAGSLIVNSDLSSARTSVENGASLRGAGRLGDTIILRGGTLSPGNSPGRMTLASLILEPNSTLNIELDGRQAGETYDQLVVTGNAQLNGDLVVQVGQALKATISPFDFFDLVTFGSVTGTPNLTLNNEPSNVFIRALIQPSAYRLIVESPAPAPIITIPEGPKQPDEAQGPQANEIGIEVSESPQDGEQLVYAIIDTVGNGNSLVNNQALNWLDQSEIFQPPAMGATAEPDVATAAIDKAIAEGISIETPSLVSDVKPIPMDILKLELPESESTGYSQLFPDFEEDEPTHLLRRGLLLASGLTTFAIGLGIAWFSYRTLKKSREQEFEEAQTQVIKSLRPSKGSTATKPEMPDSKTPRDETWTTS